MFAPLTIIWRNFELFMPIMAEQTLFLKGKNKMENLDFIQEQIDNAYRKAVELFDVAKTEDDIWKALIQCNRGNRPDLLWQAITQRPLRQDTINEMIEYVWQDNELVYQWQDLWDEIWCNYNSSYQNKLKQRIFKQPIKLYRAGDLNGEYQSWSFSKEVAEFFAIRRRESKEINERYFNAKDVVAIFNSRKEKEVVIKIDC